MKESIIFYISQYTAIKDLTDEQIGRLFRAIFEKQLGNEVVLEDDIKIAFNFINNQLVVDEKKYTEKCEKNRNNGKKGGAPIGNQNAKKTTKQPKQPNGLKNNPNDNENENDNENDNDNGVVCINKGLFSIDEKKIEKPPAPPKQQEKKIFSFVEENFGRTLAPLEYQEIDTWNDNSLTRYAIKQAILRGKYSIKYISRILLAYERENIKTVQQAQEREREYETMRKKNTTYQSKVIEEQNAARERFLKGEKE